MSHCLERGNEMIVGDQSHLHLYEQGSSAHVRAKQQTPAGPHLHVSLYLEELTPVCLCCVFVLTQVAGVHPRTVTTLPNGTFDLDEVESKIRHDYPRAYLPRSRLICVENTHNVKGGRVLPLTFLQEVGRDLVFNVFFKGSKQISAVHYVPIVRGFSSSTTRHNSINGTHKRCGCTMMLIGKGEGL